MPRGLAPRTTHVAASRRETCSTLLIPRVPRVPSGPPRRGRGCITHNAATCIAAHRSSVSVTLCAHEALYATALPVDAALGGRAGACRYLYPSKTRDIALHAFRACAMREYCTRTGSKNVNVHTPIPLLQYCSPSARSRPLALCSRAHATVKLCSFVHPPNVHP